MSDVEELVGAEIRRLAARPQSEVADMVRRVRRARRRAAIVTAAAVALVVTATSGAVWAVLRRDAQPPAPPVDVRPSGLVVTGPPGQYFVDADHGFALTCRCTDEAHETWLASTSDGGRTWQTHQVPGQPWHELLELRAFDRDRVAVGPVDWASGQTWFSADRGRTWRRPSSTPEARVAQVPPLAHARVRAWTDRPSDVLVYLPDGSAALLENAPKASRDGSVLAGGDGSLWIHDDTSTFLSRDRGRTWAPVSRPAIQGESPELQTIDGQHVYLVDRFAPGDYRIWRTTDDGKNWQRIEMPLKPANSTDVVSYAAPDGGYLIGDFRNGVEYRLAPGSDSFEPARPGLAQWMAGARYARSAGDPYEGEPPFFHSADGQNWTELRP